VNVPLPISFLFHKYLDVASAVFRPEEYLYSFHFDSGSILARAGISKEENGRHEGRCLHPGNNKLSLRERFWSVWGAVLEATDCLSSGSRLHSDRKASVPNQFATVFRIRNASPSASAFTMTFIFMVLLSEMKFGPRRRG
jgi:hypothetical protein